MKINGKRKDHCKVETLTVVKREYRNLIISHNRAFVKHRKKKSRTLPPQTNFDLIKSFDIEQLAIFLVNFRQVFGMIDNVEIAKRILESEAII